jgi:hypothetical protein
MDDISSLATFKAINDDIKAALRDLEDKISEHPCFDHTTATGNNDTFIEMLDKLFEARCSIEQLKKKL